MTLFAREPGNQPLNTDAVDDNSGNDNSDNSDSPDSSNPTDPPTNPDVNKTQLLLDVLNPTCAMLYGGVGNAVHALLGTTYTTLGSFDPSTVPDGEASLSDAQVALAQNPNAAAYTSFIPGGAPPSGTTSGIVTFLQPSFYQMDPNIQTDNLLHELKHAVGYGSEIRSG